MAFYGGNATYPAPLGGAVRVLTLTGPWPEPWMSPVLTRLPTQLRLTLRARTQTEVTVRLERRQGATWQPVGRWSGTEFSALVKHGGCPFRLWVEGNTSGWVELIETKG